VDELSIARSQTDADYAAARVLIEDYQRWLGVDLGFQGFSQELETLREMYGPPSGALLIARFGAADAGCVGLRRLDRSTCEMKRMYVREAFRGRGAGAALMDGFTGCARELGYGCVRLDTVRRLGTALGIYLRAGFREIPAYRHNPDPQAVYMELTL
jgi:GNAT superfamily N-acetyltransferase